MNTRVSKGGDAAEVARLRGQLRQLLHAAGHDLAEPARTIKSFLGLLERRHGASLAPEALELMEFAVDAADRLETMLEAILELGRIGAEPRPGTLEPVPLGPVAEAAAARQAARLEALGGRIEIGPLPALTGERKLWHRLFAILIENAVTYHGSAPPVVRIAAGPGRITVADNGIGIEPCFAERVFEPFQRLHTRDAIPGCGMGLTIARRIALHHGCTLDLAPGEAGGSVFILGLPEPPAGPALRPPPDDAGASPADRRANGGAPPGRPETGPARRR